MLIASIGVALAWETLACSLPQEGWLNTNLHTLFAKAVLVAEADVLAERLVQEGRREFATLKLRHLYKGTANDELQVEFELPTCLTRFTVGERVDVFLGHDGDPGSPTWVTLMPHKRVPAGFHARLRALAESETALRVTDHPVD